MLCYFEGFAALTLEKRILKVFVEKHAKTNEKLENHDFGHFFLKLLLCLPPLLRKNSHPARIWNFLIVFHKEGSQTLCFKGSLCNLKGKFSGPISLLFFIRKAPRPYVLKVPYVIKKENAPDQFPYCFS